MTKLTPKQQRFCEEYIIDWNATRAYQEAYKCSYEAANVGGARLLVNVSIQDYISEIQKDLKKQSGLSALAVLNELKSIGFSNLSNFHEDWENLKEFKDIPEEQKKAISEITYKKTKIGDTDMETEFVKVKLHDKQKALEKILTMIGEDEKEEEKVLKVELSTKNIKDINDTLEGMY
jgi:phage terminase small subunit